MRFADLKYGLAAMAAVLLSSCGEGVPSQEETMPSTRAVYVSFPAEASQAEAPARARLIYEEGDVHEIMYALFHNRKCVLHQTKTLPANKYYTGGDPYKLPDVNDKNLDVNTEIFVIANPTAKMKTDLNGICDDPSKTDDQRYLAWKDYVHDGDLNTESATAFSRSIDCPLMTGYLHLQSDAGAVVVVPAEHIYCRVWCYFEWRNLPESKGVVIDHIYFKNLRANTYLFDTATVGNNNNLPDNVVRTAEWTIENYNSEQQPFFSVLDLSQAKPPYHLGETPVMAMDSVSRFTHDMLCRYTWNESGIDMQTCPLRYYIYSYEWAGESLTDDVEIVVDYHFTTHDDELVHKRAKARLYDEIYFPGKRHHGLLRNYTYRLRCIINTTIDVMDMQVTSHPWYKITVDDIPPFE